MQDIEIEIKALPDDLSSWIPDFIDKTLSKLLTFVVSQCMDWVSDVLCCCPGQLWGSCSGDCCQGSCRDCGEPLGGSKPTILGLAFPQARLSPVCIASQQ